MTLETKQIGYLGYRWPVTFYTQPTYPCLFLFHATSDMAYATLDLSLHSFIKRSVLAVNDRFMFVSISVNSGKFKRDISKLKSDCHNMPLFSPPSVKEQNFTVIILPANA